MGRPTNSKWNSNWKKVRTQLLEVPEVISNRTIEAMLVASEDIATQIFERADELVPEDEGNLRDSGRVVRAKQTGRNSVEVSVAYGDEVANYAWLVHENLPNPGLQKNYTRPGSGPKYLERAGDEIIGEPSIIKTAFRKAVKTMNGR